MNTVNLDRATHPLDPYLRAERIPHIWCSGCGLGLVVNCFLRGLIKSRLDLDKVVVVSGIGCTGRAAGYINLDSFHTTHGRAIPFATGLKLANPELKVVVISGDGDLAAIGGNHLIHAARRNANNALTQIWREKVRDGVPPKRMKRNLARKLAVLAHRSLRFKEEYDDARVMMTH